MQLTFIRHSQSEINPKISIPLWGLSVEGINRANELSQNSDMQHIDVLYSSLQNKALETALLLSKPNQIPIQTDDRLTEVTSFSNRFEPDQQLYEEKFEQVYSGKVANLDDGETLIEALARFNTALEEIVKTESAKHTKNIGIVSHGNVLALFTAQYMKIPALEIQRKMKMPDYAVFDWERREFVRGFEKMKG